MLFNLVPSYSEGAVYQKTLSSVHNCEKHWCLAPKELYINNRGRSPRQGHTLSIRPGGVVLHLY
jgi:hypothetical protein